MSRKQEIVEAKALRAAGLKYREIGERMGISLSQASRFANIEKSRAQNRSRNAYKREHERNHRAPCPQCGEPMRAGSASPARRPALCQGCRRLADVATADRRGRRVEALWAKGCTLQEIALAFDWPVGRAGVEINDLRRRGYKLPYRRLNATPRFPDQVT
jgi:hypothetical protein